MAKKNPLKPLQMEVAELQQAINKKEIKCCLAWYKKAADGTAQIICKTDSNGQPWPDDIKPEYELPVDHQWIGLVQPDRYILLDSGRGASKSWTIASVFLARGIDTPIRMLSTREIQNSLRESAFALFRILIERNSLPFELMEKEIRGNNGSLISFAGIRDHSVESIKSYESYVYCWIEEAQSISARSWEILEPTIRLPGSQFFLSMNRRYRTDAIYQEFIERADPPAGLLHLQGTYKDNPFLAPDFIARAADMKLKSPETYTHIYGGCLRISSDSMIFDFEIAASPESFEERLQEAHSVATRSALYHGVNLSGLPIKEREAAIYNKIGRNTLNGLDFSSGGKLGRHAGVKLFLDNQRKLIFIKDEYYSNCDLRALPRQLSAWADDWRHVRIWADSAAPALIQDCRNYGLKGIQPVNKKIVLSEQLQALQLYTFIIHPKCQNFIDEISRYEFDVDRSGFVIDRPKKSPDHLLDAARYSLTDQITKDVNQLSGTYSPLKYATI